MRQNRFFTTHKPILPNFEVGEETTFVDYNNHISGGGLVTKVILPGDKGNEYSDRSTSQEEQDTDIQEVLYEIDTIANNVKGSRGWIRESTMKRKTRRETSLPVVMTTALYPMDYYVGIDTFSAVSVSTERADFVYLDESTEAKESVSLN